MKKLILALVVLTMMLVLVACNEGIVSVNTNITDLTGAGSKTISVQILKDTALKSDGTLVGNNSKYLIGSIDEVVAALNEANPIDGAVVSAGETTADYDTINYTFSWSSIDDYNAKMALLAVDGFAITPAAISVSGDQLTFTEDAANQKNSIMWALTAINEDPALYDPTGDGESKDDPVDAAGMATVYDVAVTVGDNSEALEYTADGPNENINVTGTITAEVTTPDEGTTPEEETTPEVTTPEEGTTPEVTTPEEEGSTPVEDVTTPVDEGTTPEEATDDDSDSPETFDGGIAAFAVVMVLAGAAVVVLKKRALN